MQEDEVHLSPASSLESLEGSMKDFLHSAANKRSESQQSLRQVEEENKMLKGRLASELEMVMHLQQQNKALVESNDAVIKLRAENQILLAENGHLSAVKNANHRLMEEFVLVQREVEEARSTIARQESTIEDLDRNCQQSTACLQDVQAERGQSGGLEVAVQVRDEAVQAVEVTPVAKEDLEVKENAAEERAEIESQAATIEKQAAVIAELEQELEALLAHHSKLESAIKSQEEETRAVSDADLKTEVAEEKKRSMELESKIAVMAGWIADVLNEQVVDLTVKLDLDFSSAGAPGSTGKTLRELCLD